jgi:uncharacterized protein (TIRG00374 family)
MVGPGTEQAARQAQEAAGVERRRWIDWLNWFGLAAGTAGLIWMVSRTGLATTAATVRAAGPALALALAIDVAATLLRARALHVFLRPAQRMVPYWRVVIAQAAASAVHDVTPTGVLGEATKVTMLAHRAPTPSVVSAVIAYDIATLLVAAVITTAGVGLVALSGAVPPPLDRALWISAGVVVITVVVLSWLARRGLARTLIAASARLHALSPARRDRWIARLADLDDRLRQLQARGRAERLEGTLWILVARALGWLELYVLLRGIGVAPGALTFAAIVLGHIPVYRVASLLPLGVGVSDVGTAALFSVLGLPASSGALLALVRRLRQIATATLGLAAMFGVQLIDRLVLARAQARVRARVRGPGA